DFLSRCSCRQDRFQIVINRRADIFRGLFPEKRRPYRPSRLFRPTQNGNRLFKCPFSQWRNAKNSNEMILIPIQHVKPVRSPAKLASRQTGSRTIVETKDDDL